MDELKKDENTFEEAIAEVCLFNLFYIFIFLQIESV